jgi:hypothetical protein
MRVHGYVIDLFQALDKTLTSVVKKQFITDLIVAVDENGEAKQAEDCTS